MRRRPRTARSVAPVTLLIGIGQYPLRGEAISTTEGNQICEQGRYKHANGKANAAPARVDQVLYVSGSVCVWKSARSKLSYRHGAFGSGVVETTIMDAQTPIVDTH
ncbi:unnamed protein product, partial [Linum tenue]